MRLHCATGFSRADRSRYRNGHRHLGTRGLPTGARKVYAVEPDEIIHRAKKAAIANGFADRIEFIQDLSTRIELPERVDGIVAISAARCLCFNGSLATLIDARTRFLEAGGWIVPACDTRWARTRVRPRWLQRLRSPSGIRARSTSTLASFAFRRLLEWGNQPCITPERLISALRQVGDDRLRDSTESNA